MLLPRETEVGAAPAAWRAPSRVSVPRPWSIHREAISTIAQQQGTVGGQRGDRHRHGAAASVPTVNDNVHTTTTTSTITTSTSTTSTTTTSTWSVPLTPPSPSPPATTCTAGSDLGGSTQAEPRPAPHKARLPFAWLSPDCCRTAAIVVAVVSRWSGSCRSARCGGPDRTHARVVEWQTRRTQNPLIREDRAGSNPAPGTRRPARSRASDAGPVGTFFRYAKRRKSRVGRRRIRRVRRRGLVDVLGPLAHLVWHWPSGPRGSRGRVAAGASRRRLGYLSRTCTDQRGSGHASTRVDQAPGGADRGGARPRPRARSRRRSPGPARSGSRPSTSRRSDTSAARRSSPGSPAATARRRR